MKKTTTTSTKHSSSSSASAKSAKAAPTSSKPISTSKPTTPSSTSKPLSSTSSSSKTKPNESTIKASSTAQQPAATTSIKTVKAPIKSSTLALEANVMEDQLRRLKEEMAKEQERRQMMPKGSIWRSSKQRGGSAKGPSSANSSSSSILSAATNFVNTNMLGKTATYTPPPAATPKLSKNSTSSTTSSAASSPLSSSQPSSSRVFSVNQESSVSTTSRPVQRQQAAPREKVSLFSGEFNMKEQEENINAYDDIHLDEEEEKEIDLRSSYQESVYEELPVPKSKPIKETKTSASTGGGGNLLSGDYDEAESAKSFQEALNAWRSGGKATVPEKSSTSSSASSSAASTEMETQAGEGLSTQPRGPRLKPEFVKHLQECTRETYFDKLEKKFMKLVQTPRSSMQL